MNPVRGRRRIGRQGCLNVEGRPRRIGAGRRQGGRQEPVQRFGRAVAVQAERPGIVPLALRPGHLAGKIDRDIARKTRPGVDRADVTMQAQAKMRVVDRAFVVRAVPDLQCQFCLTLLGHDVDGGERPFGRLLGNSGPVGLFGHEVPEVESVDANRRADAWHLA